MDNLRTYSTMILVAAVSGFAGGVISFLALAGPLSQFVKLKALHVETIRVDESVDSKFIHASTIKADDYIESKVVHGNVNRGGQFLLLDKEGHPRGMWLYGVEGEPILSLIGTGSRAAAELLVTPNGTAALWLVRNKQHSVRLQAEHNGWATLEMEGKGDQSKIRLAIDYEDDPNLTLTDHKGRRRSFLVEGGSR